MATECSLGLARGRLGFMRGFLASVVRALVGLRGLTMDGIISRRKLLSIAGLAVTLAVPAAVLTSSNADAQQNDQAPPAEPAPKKKAKKKKGASSTGMAPQSKQQKSQ